MAWTCPNCGHHIAADVPLPVHCICEKRRVDAGGEPFWVTAVKRLAKPSDRGVGDTVQRVASWLGGELFKSYSAKLGIPCGCTERQDAWNARWPYPKPAACIVCGKPSTTMCSHTLSLGMCGEPLCAECKHEHVL